LSSLDILALTAFIAAAKQDYDCLPFPAKLNAVARPKVKLKFRYVTADAPKITKVS